MPPESRNPAGRRRYFQTTRWSLVAAAADTQSPECQEALGQLCRTYWPPVYAFVRRCGKDVESSRDLTQGFFAQLLGKKYLKDVMRERGRFRSFLLASVKHYLANEWDRAQAQKRGGGDRPALDLDDAESNYRIEPVDDETPEKIFEKRWARTLLQQVLGRLENEANASPDPKRFQHLKPFLTSGEGAPYREVASELNMSEAAVKVAVHRLRKRFGALLRAEIAQTVSDPAKIDDEIRYLFSAIAS